MILVADWCSGYSRIIKAGNGFWRMDQYERSEEIFVVIACDRLVQILEQIFDMAIFPGKLHLATSRGPSMPLPGSPDRRARWERQLIVGSPPCQSPVP